MASKNVSISIELDLDDGTFTAGMIRAGTAAEEFTGTMEEAAASVDTAEASFAGFSDTLADTAVAISGIALAFEAFEFLKDLPEEVVAATGEFQRLETMMRGLSTAITDAGRDTQGQQMFQYVLDFAEKAPFSLNTLMDVFVKLKSVGIDPTAGAMQALTDAVAAFGGTNEKLISAGLSIQEMASRGVISLTQLRRQLAQAVPNAVNDMAAGLGIGMQEMYTLIKSGTLQSTDAINRMLIVMEAMNQGQGLAHMQNWIGEIQQFSTEWMKLENVMGDAGFMQAVQTQLRNVITLMQSGAFNQVATEWGQDMASFVNALVKVGSEALALKGDIETLGETLLAVFAWNKIVPFFTGMYEGAIRLAGVFQGNLTAAMSTYYAASASALNSTVALEGALGAEGAMGLAEVAGTAAAAMTFLGRAMLNIVPIVGPIVMVVLTLADAFGVVGNKAKEAAQEIKDGIITEADVSVVKQRVAALQDTMDQLQKAFNYATSAGMTQQANFYAQQIQAIESEYKQLEPELTAGMTQLGKEAATALADSTRQTLQDNVDNVANAWKTQILALEAVENSGNQGSRENQQKNAAQMKALVQGMYGDEITIVKNFLADRQAALQKDSGFQKQLDQQQINTATDMLMQLEQAYNDASKVQNPIDQLNRDAGKLTPIEQAIQHYTVAIAEASAKSQGFGAALAEVNAEIANGKFQGATTAQIAQLQKVASTYDTATAAAKKAQETTQQITTATNELAKKFQEAGQEAQTSWSQFAQGQNKLDPQELNAYKAGIEQLIAELKHLGVDSNTIAQDQTAVDQALSNKRISILSSELTTMRNKTQEFNNEINGDAKNAAQANLQNQNAAMEQLISQANLTVQQREQAEDTLTQYIAASEAEMAKKSENSIQKLGDEWGNSLKNVGDVAKTVVDGFNNAIADLVTGTKQKWQDMITNMISGLIKLELQYAEAPALKALGSFVGSFFGAPGAGGGVTPNAADGIVPIAHTGGLIGHDRLLHKHVPMSVFFSAPKFHDGGFPGLDAGEVPTILQQGEGVFTQGQMAALGSAINGANGQSGGPIQINIQNQSGMGLQATNTSASFDGQTMILNMVLRAMQQPGTFRSGMKTAMTT